MILVDAIYINNGGGKVLLDYLIDELESTNLPVFYLLDERVKNGYTIKTSNTVVYLTASLYARKAFYKTKGKIFEKVLVLGNVPPPTRLVKTVVYTYFHNSIYLSIPNEFLLSEKLKYLIKILIIKWYSNNTNFWWVQSDVLKKQFIVRFKQSEKINILPFFSSLKSCCNLVNRKRNTFLYVSNAQANKNHMRLIKAFCKAFDLTKKGELIVTVSNQFEEVQASIDEAVLKGYPVKNVGFVDRVTLTKMYLESEYIIYPSVAESFGLGIIEGIELGCKVIGADLPYTYAVCEPSSVFNPFSEDSIYEAILDSMSHIKKESRILVGNQMNEIIKILSS